VPFFTEIANSLLGAIISRKYLFAEPNLNLTGYSFLVLYQLS